MCIIVYKPAGVDMPNTLGDCWTNNSDGAGYCFISENRVQIKKGFMSYEGLLSSLGTVANIKDKDLLIHFRIATHGGINKEFCHPFPLSDNLQDLTATRIKSRMAICHNGIISGFGSKTVSDTAEYIQTVAYPLFNAVKFKHSDYTDTVIKNTISGSRFAIMDINGVRLIGNWQKFGECYYSNGNYLPYKWSYSNGTWKKDTPTGPVECDYYYDEVLYRVPAGTPLLVENSIHIVNTGQEVAIDCFGDIYEYQEDTDRYILTDWALLDYYHCPILTSDIGNAIKDFDYIGTKIVYY